jgi:hypothetical protein
MRGFLLGEETASQQFEPLGLVMHNFVAQYDEAQSQFILSRLHRFLDMGVNPNGIFFALVRTFPCPLLFLHGSLVIDIRSVF